MEVSRIKNTCAGSRDSLAIDRLLRTKEYRYLLDRLNEDFDDQYLLGGGLLIAAMRSGHDWGVSQRGLGHPFGQSPGH
eukprot:5469492-Amphidinium_carterae.2